MIIIEQKTGNLSTHQIAKKQIDLLPLHWYETRKRIQIKKTAGGVELALRFLQENPNLTEGDIVFEDDLSIIVITILPATTIILQPKNIQEAAALAYEIGNKHLPLFFDGDELLVPFEQPLASLLTKLGFSFLVDERKLLNKIFTTVLPHDQVSILPGAAISLKKEKVNG